MNNSDLKKTIRQTKAFLEAEEKTYGTFQVPEITSQPAPAPSRSDTADNPDIIRKQGGQTGTMPSSEESTKNGNSSVIKAVTESCSNAALHDVATLGELQKLCLQSDVLRTDLSDTKLVFGTGNPNAEVMLIGEAPGVQEDKQGEPFVGKAGQLLNKILAAISFEREDVYIANILKHRPPNNRDPIPEERERSLPFLYRQIELINPRIILCLGRVSAQTLLNTAEPMKSLRGRFHPFHNNIELLVTFHPAALLRNPAWKRDTWEDVKMLRRRYDNLTIDSSQS